MIGATTECDIFPVNSHKWKVCRGESKLSHRKINNYRESWGLPPLFPEVSEVVTKSPDVQVTITNRSVDRAGQSKYGPGSELLHWYNASGMPDCEACFEMCRTMNEWGVDGCRERLEEIVADILPRAMQWIAENRPFVSAMLPNILKEAEAKRRIRKDVSSAIDRAAAILENNLPEPSAVMQVANEKLRGKRTGCSSCGGRAAKNQVARPSRGSVRATNSPRMPANPVPFTDAPRLTLMFHVWPRGDSWRRHIEKLEPVLHRFDRLLLGVATDPTTATLEETAAAFGDRWEVTHVVNNPDKRHGLREVATYQQMIKTLVHGPIDTGCYVRCVHPEKYITLNNADVYRITQMQGESVWLNNGCPYPYLVGDFIRDSTNDVTFCAHAKGAQDHNVSSDAVTWWTDAMYETILYNIDGVLDEMRNGAAIAGSFRRHGKFLGTAHQWHYSGTFYAFRNAVTFSNGVPSHRSHWWGTESWPGDHFPLSHAACIFGEHAGNMYQADQQPRAAFEQWKASRATH